MSLPDPQRHKVTRSLTLAKGVVATQPSVGVTMHACTSERGQVVLRSPETSTPGLWAVGAHGVAGTSGSIRTLPPSSVELPPCRCFAIAEDLRRAEAAAGEVSPPSVSGPRNRFERASKVGCSSTRSTTRCWSLRSSARLPRPPVRWERQLPTSPPRDLLKPGGRGPMITASSRSTTSSTTSRAGS